jgi:sodium-dependent dicarboxylate transporter 2/3/5
VPVPASEPSEAGRFERNFRTAGLFIGPAAALLVYLANPGGHPPEARRLLAILAFTVVFWMTEAIPLPATALLSSSLAIVLGVAPAREVLQPYAQPIIFMFLGTFLLAEAFRKFAIDKRVATLLLGGAGGRRPGRFARSRFGRILGIGGATAAISLWISNTAAAALMTPVALGLEPERTDEPRPIMTAILLMVAYGASIGGMATLVGTPPNLLVAGFLDSLCGVDVSFAGWLMFGVPIAAVLFALSIILTWIIVGRRSTASAPDAGAAAGAPDFAASAGDAAGDLPPWRRAGARVTLGALGLAVLLWCLPSLARVAWGADSAIAASIDARLPEAGVALFCAALLFVVPVEWRRRRFALSWQDGSRINWGILMLFGGGLSLGTLAQSTGVAAWVGEGLSAFGLARSGAGLLFCAVAVTILVSEFASNTAAGTLLVPMVIAAAQAAGLDPVRPAIGVGLAATCGFIFPVSTPPNAIVFGTGLVPLRRMIEVGILLDFVSLFVVWGGLLLLTPLLPR